jgi:hypothetical protein
VLRTSRFLFNNSEFYSTVFLVFSRKGEGVGGAGRWMTNQVFQVAKEAVCLYQDRSEIIHILELSYDSWWPYGSTNRTLPKPIQAALLVVPPSKHHGTLALPFQNTSLQNILALRNHTNFYGSKCDHSGIALICCHMYFSSLFALFA